MAAMLALASSLAWGSADFLGGLAARRVGALRVLAISYPIGAILLLPFAIWVVTGDLTWDAVLWGMFAGTAGSFGMALFYTALIRGSMGIVSPLTAAIQAAIPVTVGISLGEHLGVLVICGMIFGLIAVILVSRDSHQDSRTPPLAIFLALTSGIGMGLYLTALGLAPVDSGIWAATIGRFWSTALVALVAVLVLRPRRVLGYPWRLALTVGLLDAYANGLFQLAAQRGDLAIVAVIGSLYPAATLFLARLILKERMSGIQATGVGLALAAAAALSLG